jgi:hypothetical protein
MVGEPSMTAAVARTNSADCGCRVVSEMLCSSRNFYVLMDARSSRKRFARAPARAVKASSLLDGPRQFATRPPEDA